MKLDFLFEKFELIADAPDAVPKMRALVLDWATTGRLLEQSTGDEPAAALVDQIESHFAVLRLRKAMRGTPVAPLEAGGLMTLPSSWQWVRLGNVVDYGSSEKVESLDIPEDAWLLDLEDIEKETSRVLQRRAFRENPSKSTKTAFRPGDVLYGKLRPYLNKVLVADRAGYCTTEIIPIRTFGFINPAYLCYALKRPAFIAYANSKSYGMNLPRLGTEDARHAPFPLPPLAEQKRIVAKVDELMTLCDRLEAQLQGRETRRAELAHASLARFAGAPTAANLELLFHESYSMPPGHLRKSILGLAVQGKLVPQDPDDEPAAQLIRRIGEMRRRANAKEYAPISEDDVPYDVPRSWSWIRLGNISLTSDSGWSPQCLPESREGNNWGILKVSAVSWGVFKPEENKALPPGMEPRPDCEVRPGDFLLSRANTEDLVARSVVVDQTPPRLMMSDKIVRFNFPDEVDRRYINLANTSEASRAYYARNASGTSSSMKNIGREVMCSLLIGLPPLAEQRRIVAKVNELIALVDALESQLAAARAIGAALLEAVVAELTIEANN